MKHLCVDNMTTRKELKGIAAGLYGSFISRNNDVDGYWELGKLRLHADMNNSFLIVINLVDGTIEPPSDEFSKLLEYYMTFLRRRMITRNMASGLLTAAKIDLVFNVSLPDGKMSLRTTFGSLFKLTVTLTDDRDKHYIITGFGYCAPHNSKFEFQSSRNDDEVAGHQ